MPHYCPHCAVELIEDSKFCSACGKNIEQDPETQIESQPEQKEKQHQTTAPLPKPQKSRKKLIIGISAIIIAVIIALVVIVYLLGGTDSFTGADSRFVGEWEKNSIDGPLLWKFNSDSTLETESSGGANTNVGSWNVKDTQLCLYNKTVCYSYEFSNNRSMLTLNRVEVNDDYPVNIVLTKKGQLENSKMPSITCTTDSNTNRITITVIDENIKWKDIAITTEPPATWQVQDADNIALARTGTTTTISAYVTEGDYILILVTTGEVEVTLKYIPTNSLLGTWTVFV